MSEVDEIFAALGGKSAPVSHDKPASTKKEKKASSKRTLEETPGTSDVRAKKTKKRSKQENDKGTQSELPASNASEPVRKGGDSKDAASERSKGDAPVKNGAAVPTKPKSRAPTVVHDTSNQTRSVPSQPRPAKLDEADAAFADSRGKDRKRTEEGFRVFTEDELKLNQGGGF
ncbi:hypothetical protein MBRA1_000590 [Malassezia brasiliensis]|uniref:Uncharacterized protein n=1 Tax=Malassezia brasiliensis TaxID=1821822 RepID=A0AAF0DQA0_9BASI|nr:hypothetical protein MBRA1_000590 [Malassezia brasiliensis]